MEELEKLIKEIAKEYCGYEKEKKEYLKSDKSKEDRETARKCINELLENNFDNVICVTDGGCYISGGKLDIQTSLTMLFKKLIEEEFLTKEELYNVYKVSTNDKSLKDQLYDNLEELIKKLGE